MTRNHGFQLSLVIRHEVHATAGNLGVGDVDGEATRVWFEQVHKLITAFGTECAPVRLSGRSLVELVHKGLEAQAHEAEV